MIILNAACKEADLNILKNKIGEMLGKRGKEFGTVTARKRRCGWFDGVLVRQTIKISGINGIALTKLDVLDELDEIKMCVAYEIDGKEIDCEVIYNISIANLKDEFAQVINSKKLFKLLS